jgi:hypothetical protein
MDMNLVFYLSHNLKIQEISIIAFFPVAKKMISELCKSVATKLREH